MPCHHYCHISDYIQMLYSQLAFSRHFSEKKVGLIYYDILLLVHHILSVVGLLLAVYIWRRYLLPKVENM